MDGAAFNINDQILEGLRPNFFELLSEEAMHGALRPAFQYVAKILIQSRPDWFQTLWRFADEVYLLLETYLQLFFIRKYSSSFSECFYSIKRTPQNNPTGSLTVSGKVLSMVCLVFLPYLKVKFDWSFRLLQEMDDAVPLQWSGRRWRDKLAYLFFKAYPYARSLWELLALVFRLRYLFNLSSFYSPLHLLAGVVLQRSTDLVPSEDTTKSSWLQWLTGNSFPLLVFSLKFLEWWYSAEKREAVRILTVLPVPPPPSAMKPHPSAGVRVPADPALCPLCGIHRTMPTALSSSGYVYCYRCIHGYVQDHSECPVTCLPTSSQQLVRLYPHQQ